MAATAVLAVGLVTVAAAAATAAAAAAGRKEEQPGPGAGVWTECGGRWRRRGRRSRLPCAARCGRRPRRGWPRRVCG